MKLEEFPKLPKFKFVDSFGCEWTEHQLRIGIWAVVLITLMTVSIYGLSCITTNSFNIINENNETYVIKGQ